MKYTEYLKTVSVCPFCNKENMESQTVAENSTFLLAVCLAPYHIHHLLVVPKRHIERIVDMTETEISDCMHLERDAISMMYALGYDNVSVLIKEGVHAGKSIGHIHYHVVPDIHLTNLENTMGDREVLSLEKISEYVKEFKAISK